MKKVWNKVLLSAVVLGALAGCAGEEDTIIMAPVPQVKSQFTPQTAWSASIGGGVGHYFSKLSPAYEYGKVFVASREGLVKALDPENGQTLWQTDLEGEVIARLSGGITAAYGQLYIGSENGEVIALDAESGEINWRMNVDGEVLAAPAADDNLVIVNTSRGMLVALDQTSGEQKWTISTEVPNLTLRGDSTPTTISGGVFWGTANGRLAAAIIQRGQLIWQQPIGTPQGATEIDRLVDVDASPLIIGGTLYIVGVNGQLTAIDLRSGRPAWKRKYSSALDMTTDGRTLYLVTDKDHVVAVDTRSGTELWQNDKLEHRLLTAPKLINGDVVVGDSEGYLHWINRETGEFVAQQLANDSGFAVGPLSVDDGYVIVTRDGSVKKLTIDY
ncbi:MULTISPECIES: outer membrane protein assembly factor BamB [Vibrio]|mgnify:CR=1 FL=1|uniref:Outer membrane protein assembly factor BamB n=1 Tax=Vibrio proteolyticus NBRC 13287 TaxID=1219065 RepID=U3BQ12_VIBPR|nr:MULTISPECIES: outer membrane protein assembly factor BamB [Vibrio]NAW55985.1 outer membrane protein assembly factor BamB [Vibrio sp. V36_P2S2PM302]NAX23072.1 outer membrane protein assembly factor BamB [Vibrio sp. V39_P1S14PM300]NAX24301.1 outer membrane protein assembly factor BamB [Vibrio sp. V38_P2S17PM301]NAX29485.1 outer membrane protein assembly factor BamB [Vibrio sp. V37_P2S8PM304]GAD68633.1 outer membrane protein biogenesis protein BamB [Vibrio proteolyticus NBRC 13287]